MKTSYIQQIVRRNAIWLTGAIIALFFCMTALYAYASETDGTIVTGGAVGFAWSDQVGWINFGVVNGNIHVTDGAITGYAWSTNYGWINMAPTNGGLTIGANGAITGYVWGGSLGWINFSGVTINSAGKFTGQATGVNVGTLTFSCTNCDVRTDYRASSFRTAAGAGAGAGGGGGGSAAVAPAVTTAVAPTTPPPEGAAGFPTAPAGATTVGEGATTGEDELLPEELFDIRLLIDRANVNTFAELVARVTFESFGRVPTPVDLTFTVLNSAGEEVYTGKDNVTIETTGVFVKRFTDAVELPPGSYTIRLHTLYNEDVEDDFEAAFVIGAVGGACTSFLSICLIWWIIGGIILFITIMYYILWKRRKENKGKAVRPTGLGGMHGGVPGI